MFASSMGVENALPVTRKRGGWNGFTLKPPCRREVASSQTARILPKTAFSARLPMSKALF